MFLMQNYSRQNVGVKRTSKVKTSNRPNNIVITNIHLAAGFIEVKLSATTPKPGPRLFKVAVTAAKAENSSTPVAMMANMLIMKTKAYAEKNPRQLPVFVPVMLAAPA
ncbi:AraC family transcriptional regulator [Yersinia enterocolitica]|nr:AraC family transcriptional regulator [Yersinia enterocolitica]